MPKGFNLVGCLKKPIEFPYQKVPKTHYQRYPEHENRHYLLLGYTLQDRSHIIDP